MEFRRLITIRADSGQRSWLRYGKCSDDPREGEEMLNGLILHSLLTKHMSILEGRITKTVTHSLTGKELKLSFDKNPYLVHFR